MKLCNYYTKSCDFPAGKHKCCVAALLKMLESVSKLFTKNKIPFFLTAGTLLGWRRHGGIIPWDDDLDIACLHSDLEKIEAVMEEVRKEGFDVVRTTGKGKGDNPDYDYYVIYYSKNNRNHLDISLMTEFDNYLFDGPQGVADSITTPEDFNQYKMWIMDKKDVFPLHPSTFYGIECFVPNNPDSILKRFYGNDVFKHAYVKPEPMPGSSTNIKKVGTTEFLAAPTLKTKTEKQSPNRELGIVKAFIINLDTRMDRLHNSIEQCDKIGIHAEKVSATTLTDEDVSSLEEMSVIKVDPSYRRMKNGEYACTLSHIDCWNRIAKEPKGVYMVLEDDIYFTPNFKKALIHNRGFINSTDDVIRLGAWLDKNEDVDKVDDYLYEIGYATGTWAYLLRPDQAKKLLEKIFPVIYPVDVTVITFDEKKFPFDKSVYDKRFNGRRAYLLNTESDRSFHNNIGAKDPRKKGVVGEVSTIMNDSTSYKDSILNQDLDLTEITNFTNHRTLILKIFLLVILLLLVSIVLYGMYLKINKRI